MDELLDLVDQHDQVIGQKMRSEVYAENLSNFRAVNAFLVNDQGQLWIPRRTKHKKLFPLCLDASMGGHVGAGETYEQALARELMEELRIDLALVPYERVGILTPHEHNTAAFMHVYVLRFNEAPDYNPEDFIEFYWLSPQELLDRIAKGDPSKGDLPKMVTFLKHVFLVLSSSSAC